MSLKLIKPTDYLLLIDEKAEVCRGQHQLLNNEVELIHEGHNYPYKGNRVIAYYPLTKEAKELDLPLLPNPFEDMNYDELEIKYYQELEEKRLEAINFKGQVAGRHPDNLSSREIHAKVSGFIEGYKAASKQFTLDDVKKAIEMAREQDCSNFEYYGFCEKTYTDDDIIQSLSTKQLPIDFIPEYEYHYHSSKEFYIDAKFVKCSKEQYESIKEEIPTCPVKVELKTITNSEGKEELVGVYKY